MLDENPPYPVVPLLHERLEDEEARARSVAFLRAMQRRRSVRQFSLEPVPFELVANAVRTAGTAPSGAHQQPWTFVVVSDPAVKQRIRSAAEPASGLRCLVKVAPPIPCCCGPPMG